MSKQEIYYQNRKQTLIEQINKITGSTDDYSDWSLNQLDILHSKVVAKYRTFKKNMKLKITAKP